MPQVARQKPELPAPAPLSQVFAALPTDRAATLAELLAAFGSRAHGGAILLLGLPDALPWPVPSVSTILGIPLVIVSAHLALHGEGGRLPRGIAERQVPQRLVAAMARRLPPVLAWVEHLTRPRWRRVAGREHLLGWVCLYLSLLLVAPLPFFNMPPSLCLVLLAWGMIQRDGIFVAAGLAGTAAVTAALAVIALWARSLLT